MLQKQNVRCALLSRVGERRKRFGVPGVPRPGKSARVVLWLLCIGFISLSLVSVPAGVSAPQVRPIVLPIVGGIVQVDQCPTGGPFGDGTFGDPIKFNVRGVDTVPAAINHPGQVAGVLRPGSNQKLKGFVRNVNGSFAPAPWFGPDYDVYLTWINDLGQFVGYAGSRDDPYGFFDSRGDMLHGYAPLAVNNLGQSIGVHQYSTWGGLFHYTDGFLRDANGHLTSLDKFQPVGINNVGQVAGAFPANDGGIFDPGAIYRPAVREPDGNYTPVRVKIGGREVYPAHPVSINDLGDVVGYWQDSNGNFHGFLHDANGHDASVDDHLDANARFTNTYPTWINNLRQVVGWADNGDDPRVAFMRDGNGKFYVFGTAGPGGTTRNEAKWINDQGQAVGTYNDGGAIYGFVQPTTVEPLKAFSVTRADIVPSTGAITVFGSFTPCPGRTLNPVADPVLVKLYQPGVAWASIAIPGSSFQDETRKYVYNGVLRGVPVSVYLWGPLSDGHWDFRVYVTGLSGLPSTNPVTVFLAIGNNTGAATVNANY